MPIFPWTNVIVMGRGGEGCPFLMLKSIVQLCPKMEGRGGGGVEEKYSRIFCGSHEILQKTELNISSNFLVAHTNLTSLF